MNKFVHIVFFLSILIITLGCSRNNPKEEVPTVRVVFQMEDVSRDKETGDVIPFVQFHLFSMSDTTFINDFYTAIDTIENKVVNRSIADAVPGSQFLVSVGTLDTDPDITTFITEEDRINMDRIIRELQGWHQTAWLGPYTIPDNVDYQEDYVIKISAPILDRVPDSLSVKNPEKLYIKKSKNYN